MLPSQYLALHRAGLWGEVETSCPRAKEQQQEQREKSATLLFQVWFPEADPEMLILVQEFIKEVLPRESGKEVGDAKEITGRSQPQPKHTGESEMYSGFSFSL